MTQATHPTAPSAAPRWKQPIVLLFVMAAAMPISFATWSALLNNFVIDVAQFDGSDIGWLHTVREIPGFLAIGVIVLLMLFKEQFLGLLSLLLLGVATAVTAWFPTFGGIMIITLLSSIGFHYYETVNQSLQLQWLPKKDAPRIMGKLLATGSAATLVSYGLIVVLWDPLGLTYNIVYMVAGGVTSVIAIAAMVLFPSFAAPNPQLKKFVLRRRYWLYYVLQFMAGARRQIFVVFAGFMMVERFGFDVHEVTGLFLITLTSNIFIAPLIGRAVGRFGERRTLLFEYIGLVTVFSLYGGIYYFGWGVVIASTLYVIDNLLFAMALALKTYFQKIADPQDIAPTAAVAFTINHIAAVFLPAGLGYLWLISPAAVFGLAASFAAGSFCLALLIPRHPEPGFETIFQRRLMTGAAE
ncbi:MFS transporter [Pseudooceanicola nanhaiensis]|uniref:MFS transporter n=1 Tax=Pseudooceanicola nanhaiensis TaxID=375761 RepID=UPI001CD33435|nr:MFS transporter [Pseudooceanicola nanhaiensis]MCA0922292.1 MFS transporter [Pseudooceanicola nanhaiensis]